MPTPSLVLFIIYHHLFIYFYLFISFINFSKIVKINRTKMAMTDPRATPSVRLWNPVLTGCDIIEFRLVRSNPASTCGDLWFTKMCLLRSTSDILGRSRWSLSGARSRRTMCDMLFFDSHIGSTSRGGWLAAD